MSNILLLCPCAAGSAGKQTFADEKTKQNRCSFFRPQIFRPNYPKKKQMTPNYKSGVTPKYTGEHYWNNLIIITFDWWSLEAVCFNFTSHNSNCFIQRSRHVSHKGPICVFVRLKTAAASSAQTIDFQACGVMAVHYCGRTCTPLEIKHHTQIKWAVSPDVASFSHHEQRKRTQAYQQRMASPTKRTNFTHEMAMYRQYLGYFIFNAAGIPKLLNLFLLLFSIQWPGWIWTPKCLTNSLSPEVKHH